MQDYQGPRGLSPLVVSMDRSNLVAAGTSPQRQRRLVHLVTVHLVAATLLFAGCLDVVFPQAEPVDDTPTNGQLRVFAATRPGAVANEFVHYNITFGQVGHARDLYLEDVVLMEPRERTVDLVELEAQRKAALVAVDTVRDGEYYGFGFFISRASLATERIIGNENGRAVTQIEEHVIDYSETHVTPRAPHVVFGGRTTDIFLEIDLQRSLQRLDDGAYKHVTVPAGISVYVDGTKVHEYRMDGGASRAQDGETTPGSDTDTPSVPPRTSLEIKDPDTEARHYYHVTQLNKRMKRAVGLAEDLVFDASQSRSHYVNYDPEDNSATRVPIVDHRWDFGDGTHARGARVVKNYTEGGLYDVVLEVRDAHDLTSRDHVTIFVPYTAEQREDSRSASETGSIALASSVNPVDPSMSTNEHTFRFAPDQKNGTLHLGGYRVELHPQNPTGDDLAGLQDVRLTVKNGHFNAEATGPGPHILETAGVPVWRGPLKPWAGPEFTIQVELVTGALLDYDLNVEAHYYENLSRGLDPHHGHIHGDWPFGPDWRPLHWNGTPARDDEDAD